MRQRNRFIYVQDRDIAHWHAQLDTWIDEIVNDAVTRWPVRDKVAVITQNAAVRMASLQSHHSRRSGLDPIQIDHL